jgi:hypothetical protein
MISVNAARLNKQYKLHVFTQNMGKEWDKSLVRPVGMMHRSNRVVTNSPFTINSAVIWTMSLRAMSSKTEGYNPVHTCVNTTLKKHSITVKT